ncbi:MAG TPA: hypothetical protein VLA56_17495 [Pseudomonadales bacterium]|nr:hypothetical protein [Pseudomonadales bacterium]
MNAPEILDLVIPEQFRGPPRSANGGYACGIVARRLQQRAGGPLADAPITVSLRSPPPLDVPMRVAPDPRHADALHLLHGDTLVAEGARAAPGTLDMRVPPAPSHAAAAQALATSPAFWPRANTLIAGGTGVHPVCVCCGEDLTPETGLRVQAAAVPGFEGVAAAWTPHAAFDDGSGLLAPELIWTALDCPGQFAWLERDPGGEIRNHALLGRFTVRIDAPVRIGEACVVTGWRLEEDGRKFGAGTALFGADGSLRAVGRALWVRFDPSRMRG